MNLLLNTNRTLTPKGVTSGILSRIAESTSTLNGEQETYPYSSIGDEQIAWSSKYRHAVFAGFTRRSRLLGSLPSLPVLLHVTLRYEASDPRDKIFALLGIADISDLNSPILPDYSSSLAMVYTKLAMTFLDSRRDLAVFEDLDDAVTSLDDDPQRPTWVPCFLSKHSLDGLNWKLIDSASFFGAHVYRLAKGKGLQPWNKGEIPCVLFTRRSPTLVLGRHDFLFNFGKCSS
ncbi:Ankyrin and HET domain protein [Apiospora phragmitis]|uniref:Ankyrin and HET domain protein n=1 Tax=Apiospora phragmitis TaxID=2905665 RepID=A0ABR1W763_9PEZI